MFRHFADMAELAGESRGAVLERHPAELARAAEVAFAAIDENSFYFDQYTEGGDTKTIEPMSLALPSAFRQAGPVFVNGDLVPPAARGPVVFMPQHLIYAFLVENTRLLDVFQRVLLELGRGEALDIPSFRARQWARNAEELFFKDGAQHGIMSVASELRPSNTVIRRNAYYRLMGLELNYGGEAIAFHKPKAANTEFVDTFERFLSAVWIGIANKDNTSGSNPTDRAGIAQLIRRLRSMLRNRRRSGALLREEFAAVAAASYFHLTVEDNTPIIRDLRCEAESPEERLKRLGERVGVPVHARAEYYFAMADSASQLLIDIEVDETLGSDAGIDSLLGLPSNPPGAVATALAQRRLTDVQTVITNWSLATGRNLKVSTADIRRAS